MVIERQIDDTLYSYDTKAGNLVMVDRNGRRVEIDHAMLYGLLWFLRMASVAGHADRLERKRLADMQD